MEFEYISDSGFQEILKRDFIELKKCQEVKAAKSILILCGSILEAVLADYFSENLPVNVTKAGVLQLPLSALLDHAESSMIINKSDKSLATVIKDYRNIIHPGREVRKQENFDIRNAELSIQILELILSKIEYKYKEKYDLNADDILFNLNEDWHYRSIYGSVITKLNSNQREKLFNELVEIEIELKEAYAFFNMMSGEKTEQPVYENITNVKEFTLQLKPLLSKEAIMSKLGELKKSVTSGEKLDALSFFNILHEEIVLLSPEDQELIGIYIITVYSQTCFYIEANDYYHDKTFSTIGKYLCSQKALEKVKEAFQECIISFTMNPMLHEMDTFEQVLNSFSEDIRKRLLKDIESWIDPNSEIMNVEDFRQEAIKRGLIQDTASNDVVEPT